MYIVNNNIIPNTYKHTGWVRSPCTHPVQANKTPICRCDANIFFCLNPCNYKAYCTHVRLITPCLFSNRYNNNKSPKIASLGSAPVEGLFISGSLITFIWFPRLGKNWLSEENGYIDIWFYLFFFTVLIEALTRRLFFLYFDIWRKWCVNGWLSYCTMVTRRWSFSLNHFVHSSLAALSLALTWRERRPRVTVTSLSLAETVRFLQDGTN